MLRKKTVKFIAIILVILIALSLFLSYQSSIRGTVVDAETGQPIKGAVVLVEWTKQIGIGDYHTASMKVVETVTNTEGKFNVFGPFHPFVDSPDVTIYKKGYVAWNNKFIFPKYEKRKQVNGLYRQIRLELFDKLYSHKKHVFFIEERIHNELVYDEKAVFRKHFSWEIDLAIKE